MSVDLQPLHTFSLPATATKLVTITSLEDWCEADLDNDYIILGEGSNTVFVEDYSGTIVKPCFTGIAVTETESSYSVKVGATENWHQLVTHCLTHQMPGLENLALIPGTVGAAPVQNIGAYGVEISDFINTVHAIDLQTRQLVEFTADQCQFEYRDSLFKRNPGRWMITHVTLSLPKDWRPNLTYPALHSLHNDVSAKDVFEHVIQIRQSKLPDPITLPNAGSFFKNPIVSEQQLAQLKSQWPELIYYSTAVGYKIAAGWLLEKLGLKGYIVGGIAVHDKQALVLVNADHGSGQDLLKLCGSLQNRVADASGIFLEPEVRLIGSNGLKTELYWS